MIGPSLLLVAAAAPAEVRLALEATPTEVFLAHPGSAPALLAIRPSGGARPLYLALGPGASARLAVPAGLDTSGIVFDYATAEGPAVGGVPLFAEGGRTRRSLVLFEPESSTYGLVAAESAASLDSTGGSTSNLTIGPPPPGSGTSLKGDVLLFPDGAYRPEPVFQPVGGYYPPF